MRDVQTTQHLAVKEYATMVESAWDVAPAAPAVQSEDMQSGTTLVTVDGPSVDVEDSETTSRQKTNVQIKHIM